MKTLSTHITESFVNEAKKKRKTYNEVKVGDMAMENPDAGGVWDNELGEIIWKGKAKDLPSKWKDLIYDWDMTTKEIDDNYDLVIVDVTGIQGGPTLYNYDNDPSGCVVFK